MATWDGSSHEVEESDRFVYSDENSVAHNVPSWIFYPSNENVFLQTVDVPYCPNAIVALKQSEESGSRLCELKNVHGVCQGQGIVQDGTERAAEAATHDTTRYNAQGSLVYRGKRVRNYKSNKQYLETNTSDNSNVVQHSNLHPTANEFIPHSLTQFYAGGQRNNNTTSDTVVYEQESIQSARLSSSRERYEKRYRTKKNIAHKEKMEENWHAQRRDTFKSNHKAQHGSKYGKHQNGTGTYRQHRNSCAVDVMKQMKQSEVGESGVSGVVVMSYDSERPKSRDKEENRRKRLSESNLPGCSGATSTVRRLRSSKEWKTNRYECVNREKWGKSQENTKDCKEKNKSTREETSERELMNWRQKGECNNKSFDTQKRRTVKRYEDDDASQRERLTEQLNRGQLECLVCCEYIKQCDYIWSCLNCYHVLHLKCVKKWAKSSQADNGWRCPACQNVSTEIPQEYYCFCGKTTMPEWNRRDVAHSCGEVCGRSRSKNNCSHKCTLLCHPGSCPPCITMITKSCGCGRTSQTVQCSADTLLLCDATCGKELNCGKHTCQRKCHHGECGTCDEIVKQECYCGKSRRETTCRSDVSLTYCCEGKCEKLLNCGNHKCEKLCHPGACECCRLTPEYVSTCCCGQTSLEAGKRKSCLDAIPVCDKVCSKPLKCGQPSNPHRCAAKCHEDECPECDLSTVVKCRCGNMDREIACKDLTTKADDARCEKKCTKKRSCGKHKCNQLCCIDVDHICPLPCSKTLSCGRHKCEQTCHKGRCQSCWRSSFEELYCECGMAVIYPPVPCGTRRPVCDRPCSRQHPCEHEVFHNCHSEVTCPPCTVLTQKWCHGKHELRKAVPCYVNEISCGLPCNKMLSCGRHKCITTCHSGACEKAGHRCTQPCTTIRELCGHMCGAPCHEGKCPDTPCKEIVKVTCQCGHRSSTRVCAENAREYQRIASNILASKMADMQLGHSIDLEEVFGQGTKRQNQLKTLECNDECKLIERNRRLALGLQIVNPDLSGKLMPRYSDFMKQWAKKDAHFCQMVHDKLTELVQLAKTSKQKSRSYSFDSMNRDKRHFIHESCEHFGCESQAYDQEPKRNVVATAVKDKCWLPSYSLLEIVQRENGQRKVPGPMLNTSKANSSSNRTILALPLNRNQKSLPAASTSRSPEPEIDYFEYKGFDCK